MKANTCMHRPRIAILLIALVSLFFLAGCPGSGEKPGLEKYIGIMIEMCTYASMPSGMEYTDMLDGTIRVRYYSFGLDNTCGKVLFPDSYYYSDRGYIKKCLQGQVYRSVENDCQGTGSSPDWGAVKYQFCATNDRACDMQVLDKYGIYQWSADPAKSPAAISCAGDTTAGRAWQLLKTDMNFIDSTTIPTGDIRINFPEMPLGSTELIWDNSPYYTGTAYAYYFDANGFAQSGYYQNKDSLFYVLCISK